MADPLFDDLLGLLCFARAVEHKSFSRAARALGVSKSVVSTRIAKLEERLNERLIVRTTRKLEVTDQGLSIYARSARMVEEASAALRGGTDAGRGRIRVNAPVSLAQMYLAEPLARFASLVPDVHVELHVADRLVDLVEERVDVAIRVSKLADSGLTAKKLGSTRLHVVASPAYLARRGRPARPEDLLRHDCLRYAHLRMEDEWRFYGESGRIRVPVQGPLTVTDGTVLREAAAAGMGLAVLPRFIAEPHLMAGTLVTVLDDYAPRPLGIYAVRAAGRTLPQRVRKLLEVLGEAFRGAGDAKGRLFS